MLMDTPTHGVVKRILQWIGLLEGYSDGHFHSKHRDSNPGRKGQRETLN